MLPSRKGEKKEGWKEKFLWENIIQVGHKREDKKHSRPGNKTKGNLDKGMAENKVNNQKISSVI